MKTEIDELSKFLPPGTSEDILFFLNKHRARLTIKNHRKSKFGDYRPPDRKLKLHQISVNGTLNPYAFLITLLHEMAHLLVYETFKGRVSPHGKEWKMAFSKLLNEWLERKVFPESIEGHLTRYARNPKASTFSDHQLYAALNEWDHEDSKKTYLRDLLEEQRFGIGKKVFSKGPLRRTRHLCKEEKSGRQYLIHFMAEVTPLS